MKGGVDTEHLFQSFGKLRFHLLTFTTDGPSGGSPSRLHSPSGAASPSPYTRPCRLPALSLEFSEAPSGDAAHGVCCSGICFPLPGRLSVFHTSEYVSTPFLLGFSWGFPCVVGLFRLLGESGLILGLAPPPPVCCLSFLDFVCGGFLIFRSSDVPVLTLSFLGLVSQFKPLPQDEMIFSRLYWVDEL